VSELDCTLGESGLEFTGSGSIRSRSESGPGSCGSAAPQCGKALPYRSMLKKESETAPLVEA
jgi:hypothetical protein